jgi:hypothetical protein
VIKETITELYFTYIYSNNDRHPVIKTFTPLHYTYRHFTSSHLHFTQLHFTTLSSGLTPFKFPTASFHLISLYFTSLHFTSLHFTAFQTIFTTLLFLSLRPVTNTLKISGLQGKVPKASAGSWFQFLWSYLQRNTSRYPLPVMIHFSTTTSYRRYKMQFTS